MKAYSKIYSILFFVVLIVSTSLYAQDAQKTISKIQKKYKSIKNLNADFYQSMVDKNEETIFELSGKFYYAPGGKFKIDLQDRLIISDGKSIWNVDNILERVIISNVDNKTNTFSLEKFIFEIPDECDAELVENELNSTSIVFTPQGNLGFKNAKITVDKSLIINIAVITDLSGNTISFGLSNVKTNTTMSKDSFNYVAPKGIEIIDLR
ncbi:MAG: hypothetical protein CVV23_13240 [Ignavibacteriae bacterium HGW-Ignavibacteriae-2]|nr:MAG: hypothetical protein CVV23_13240 [Ignavibacteriae bacterium HGW-Ignavibacteriae-2]